MDAPTTTKTLAFNSAQLLILLDAMDGIDAVDYYNSDEEQIDDFDKLYKRLFVAYQKSIS